jgi:sec-independent protein translocase protein TatB
MFDIGWTELFVIGVVALIAIGPKELPGVLRSLGQWMGKIRRMAAEFQGQFQEAMREAEMEDLKKHVDSLTDPLESVRKEVEAATAFEDRPASSPAASDDTSPASPAAAETTVATDAEAPVAPAEPAAPEPDQAVRDADVKEAGGRAA